MVGMLSYYFKYKNEKFEAEEYDYSREDSVFLAKDVPAEEEKNVEKDIDSKPELLNFSGDKLESKSKNASVLSDNKIDINNAGTKELVTLPGIGEITAEKIINLRKERGGFKKASELIDVDGIGEIKFNKIKKYIFIE